MFVKITYGISTVSLKERPLNSGKQLTSARANEDSEIY